MFDLTFLKSFSSLSVVKTISVSITLNILNKSLFKSCSLLLLFIFFFKILMHKNVLTLSVKVFSADLSVLLMKVSM